MAKLKDLINEIGIGGMVFPEAIGDMKRPDGASLLKIAKDIVAKEEDEKLMTKEDLVEKVSNFASYGPSIYKKHNLAEVAELFVEISKAAQKHVVDETEQIHENLSDQESELIEVVEAFDAEE